MTALIEVHYLPSIAYFALLQRCHSVIIEKNENFVKQSYRNRCQIVTAGGVQNLIVPVTMKHGKVPITDVRIDYSQKWLNNHWRAVQSAYGKAPFFEYYQEDLHKTLQRKFDFLYDLNIDLLSMCLRWLRKDLVLNESLTYSKPAEKEVWDLRSALNVKKENNTLLFYRPVLYTQVFGSAFVVNPSIIDLIFCAGPEAARIVEASSVDK